jgi:pimeloyl-ACP methyl ester carboxylesterase
MATCWKVGELARRAGVTVSVRAGPLERMIQGDFHMLSRTMLTLSVVLSLGLSSARADKTDEKAPFGVKIVGKGTPMIFIPGLSSAGEVWDSTVAHFKDRHECHVLTLAGFAGQPAIRGPFLDTMQKAIIGYIKEKKLKKPIIVGHSLGGFLVFAISSREPDLIGAVIAVDGLPCFPAIINDKITADELKKGSAIGQSLARATREEFLKQQRSMMGTWISDKKKLAQVIEWTEKSDQATVARALGELWTRDLREDLKKIKAPVLLLVATPYDAYGATAEQIRARCEAQVTNVKEKKVVFAKKAKHFIMFDEPKWLCEQIDEFLGKK